MKAMTRWVVLALLFSTAAWAGPKALVGRWGIFGEELCELKSNGVGSSTSANANFRWSEDDTTLRFILPDGRVTRFHYTLAGDHLILASGSQTLYTFRLGPPALSR